MPTERKIAQVEELKDKLSRCTIAIATNHTGLNGNTLGDLRRQLRQRGIDFRVVKNTLTYLAGDVAGKPKIREVVQGPTALAFGYGDPTEVAKALQEYIRATRSVMTIRGALMDSQALTAEDVTSLAALPPRLQIISMLLGQLQSPAARLVRQLQAPMARLVGSLNATLVGLAVVLEQRVKQLETAKPQD